MITAASLKNLLLTSLKKMVPEELWISKRENVGHLGIFGCLTYVEIPKEKRKKS